MGLRADLRLLRRAMNNRWPVTEEFRAKVIEKIMERMADPDVETHHLNALAKTLLAAEAQNQSDEHHARGGRITEIFDALGIQPSVGAIESSGTETSPEDDGLEDEADE